MADDIDRAQAAEERHRQEALAARERFVLEPVAPATGSCIECEAPIDPRRLIAIPGALRCLGCQQGHERRGGR